MEKLERAFLSSHADYKEPVRQMELQFDGG